MFFQWLSYEILDLRNGISLKLDSLWPSSCFLRKKRELFPSLLKRCRLARAEIKTHPSTPAFYLKHDLSCCRRLLDIF